EGGGAILGRPLRPLSKLNARVAWISSSRPAILCCALRTLAAAMLVSDGTSGGSAHELGDVGCLQAVSPAAEVAGACLLWGEVDHPSKTELVQPNCKVLRADACEPGLARSGGIFGHCPCGGGFFNWQVDVGQHETEDDGARRGKRGHHL